MLFTQLYSHIKTLITDKSEGLENFVNPIQTFCRTDMFSWWDVSKFIKGIGEDTLESKTSKYVFTGVNGKLSYKLIAVKQGKHRMNSGISHFEASSSLMRTTSTSYVFLKTCNTSRNWTNIINLQVLNS